VDRAGGGVTGGVAGGVADSVTNGVANGVTDAVADGGAGPVRVLLAKVGLDGHDRGLRVVARLLRDAGMEVVYAGLRQSPEAIAATAVQEDVDVVGVSMHNGAHLTLAPLVVDALRSAGLAVPVVVGGIVPTPDVPRLQAAGVAAVLGPGTSDTDVVAIVRRAAASPASGPPSGPASGPAVAVAGAGPTTGDGAEGR
jgi:methylmalonyl-CoA mutase cobalamin-binding domain/chain